MNGVFLVLQNKPYRGCLRPNFFTDLSANFVPIFQSYYTFLRLVSVNVEYFRLTHIVKNIYVYVFVFSGSKSDES